MNEAMIAPCPFCGLPAKVDRSFPDHKGPSCYIGCSQCDFSPEGCYRNADEWELAIAAWNTRTPAEPRPADGGMIERARKLIAIVVSHVKCTDAGATWLHATDAEDEVVASLAACNPNERLREALERVHELETTLKCIRRTAKKAGLPIILLQQVHDAARSALSSLPQGED